MRVDAGLTQAELGKLIGVSDRVVGYYEANVHFPKKPQTLIKLSEVFNVSVDFLEGNSVVNKSDQYGNIEHKRAKGILKDVDSLFADDKLSVEGS